MFRAGLVFAACFAPQKKGIGNARKAAFLCPGFLFCREKLAHRPPGSVNFPMPVAPPKNRKMLRVCASAPLALQHGGGTYEQFTIIIGVHCTPAASQRPRSNVPQRSCYVHLDIAALRLPFVLQKPLSLLYHPAATTLAARHRTACPWISSCISLGLAAAESLASKHGPGPAHPAPMLRYAPKNDSATPSPAACF